MNAEKLHSMMSSIVADHDGLDTAGKFERFRTQLQQYSNRPQSPHQESASNHLRDLLQVLDDSASNKFPPTWEEPLTELGLYELTGARLAAALRQIFERNQITPALALQEITVIHDRWKTFDGAARSIVTGFTSLNISRESLVPGECEIGILIPRKAVGNTLHGFKEELENLDFIFSTFGELANGERTSSELRTISSSELLVFLKQNAPTAALFAAALERLIAVYKQLLEIRKLRNELLKQGVPIEDTEKIEKNASDRIEKAIDEIVDEHSKQSKKSKDDHRKSELKNALRISLKKIAVRIDRGFNFEVTMSEPVSKEGEPAPDKDDYSRIREAQVTLKFMKLEGEAILKLEDGGKK